MAKALNLWKDRMEITNTNTEWVLWGYSESGVFIYGNHLGRSPQYYFSNTFWIQKQIHVQYNEQVQVVPN